MTSLHDKFLEETDFCKTCGSQRCDCSPEWIEGCQHFQKFSIDYGVKILRKIRHKERTTNGELDSPAKRSAL